MEAISGLEAVETGCFTKLLFSKQFQVAGMLSFVPSLLRTYDSINQKLAAIALKKKLGYLWYLSEKLVSHVFFET